jgi:hypothetical protein
MSTILFANDAQSTLAGSITNVALTANLAAGTGVLFPAPGAGQYFVLSFIDAATGLLTEIVHVTNVTGDVITMVRAQEGTTALAWTAGDIAANLCTAGTMQAFTQFVQSQLQSTNYAADSGVANAYVVTLSPPVTAITAGMPIRVKIGNTNTGASTLNFGAGALSIINPDGTALGASSIVAGGIYEFVPDGSGHVILTSASNAILSVSGILTTGDMKFRATSETLAGYVKANATTIGDVSSNGTQLASATAAQLFSWLWTNFSNTQCPVLTSGGVPTTRGGSAAADFSAEKQITVLDWRGVGPKGLDDMGNTAANKYTGVPFVSGNATTPGSVAGENTHVLTTAESAAHTHTASVTDPGHGHTVNNGVNLTNTNGGSQWGGGGVGAVVTVTVNANTTGITVSNASTGGGGAHNTVDLSMLGTWYLKL